MAVTPNIRGSLESIGFVIAVGALTLTYGIGHTLGAHPLAFVLYAMLFAGIGTLLLAGWKCAGLAILTHSASWMVGSASVLVELFYYLMLTEALPAHGNVVLRISIPLAMVCGWMVLRRRPPAIARVGGFGIIAAATLALHAAPQASRLALVLTAGGGAICVVLRSFAMEFHPWNRRASTVSDKLRVTGVIILAASVVGLLLAAAASAAVNMGLVRATHIVPTAAQVAHVPTVLLAACMGGGILTIMTYLNLSAVARIGTENMVVVMAFTSVSAWLFQQGGAMFGLVRSAPLDTHLAGALIVLATSVLLVLLGKGCPARSQEAGRTPVGEPHSRRSGQGLRSGAGSCSGRPRRARPPS